MKCYFSLHVPGEESKQEKTEILWLMNTKTTTLNDMETVKIQTISQN